MISELKRFVLSESFDEQPFPKLSSEDIDFRVASELFSEVSKLRLRDLETLNIVTKHQGHLVPTIGGIILFGNHRNKYFPNSWIQAGRFAGKDKRYIVNTIELKSYPIIALNEAMDFVRKHSMRKLEIKGIKHGEQWSLPLTAFEKRLLMPWFMQTMHKKAPRFA